MRQTARRTAVIALALLVAACNNHEGAMARTEGFYVGQVDVDETAVPDVYVFFDTQCPYCAEQWRNFEVMESPLLVKWIPVAVLNDASATQAAMLLESEDALALMAEHQAIFRATGRAPTGTIDVSDEAKAAVQQNNDILAKLGTRSVPTILYRDRATRKLIVTSGVVPTSELERVLGTGVPPAAAR